MISIAAPDRTIHLVPDNRIATVNPRTLCGARVTAYWANPLSAYWPDPMPDVRCETCERIAEMDRRRIAEMNRLREDPANLSPEHRRLNRRPTT